MKPELGKKHQCPSCGCKFYDLQKPEPLCPRCGAKVGKKQEYLSKKTLEDALDRDLLSVIPKEEEEVEEEKEEEESRDVDQLEDEENLYDLCPAV